MIATRRRSGQSGAVLVHVAIALLGLIAFCALAIDYGVLWVARGRAQNAADAAALAGAISLAFDRPGDQAAAVTAALAAGHANVVWPDGVQQTVTAEIINCPAGQTTPADQCVRARVFRNKNDALNGVNNPLPTFFARVFNYGDQGVRATATAQVAQGSYVNCLKPWAIPDKWWDVVDQPNDNQWGWDDQYDRYEWVPNQKTYQLRPDPTDRDAYWKPAESDPDGVGRAHPGFTPGNDDDIGVIVNLKAGNPSINQTKPVEASWFFRLDLQEDPTAQGGTDDYRHWITNCFPGQRTVDAPGTADDLYSYVQSLPGNANVPTRDAVEQLIARDPGATWNPTGGVDGHGAVENSAFAVSPRIVPIPIISIEDYIWNYQTQYDAGVTGIQGRFRLPIIKILAFFILPYGQGQGANQADLRGVFLGDYPARVGGGASPVPGPSPYLRSVILIR